MIATLIFSVFIGLGGLFCGLVYYGRLQTALKRVAKLQRNNDYLRGSLRRDAKTHTSIVVNEGEDVSVNVIGEDGMATLVFKLEVS